LIEPCGRNNYSVNFLKPNFLIPLLKGNFLATAWNNGRHYESGSGYGLKINISDALAHFKKVHKSIRLKLDGQKGEITVNIDKQSFWSKDCCELINKEVELIKKYLNQCGLDRKIINKKIFTLVLVKSSLHVL